jgi:hypothetical protein
MTPIASSLFSLMVNFYWSSFGSRTTIFVNYQSALLFNNVSMSYAHPIIMVIQNYMLLLGTHNSHLRV